MNTSGPVVSAVLVISTLSFALAAPSLPDSAKDSADRALRAASTLFAEPSSSKTAEAARSFAEAMSQLADRVDSQLSSQIAVSEAESIESKLVTVAADRKQHPDIYGEIERIYIKGVANPASRAPAAPSVQAAHATEKYRLVWEYFLLKPPEAPSFKSDLRAMEALGRIGNPASVVTLLQCYRITAIEGIPSRRVDTRQTWLLRALGEFRTAQSLRAMLECVTLSKRQQRNETEKSDWDPERFLRETLSAAGSRKQEWRQVIDSLPNDLLSAEEAKLLRHVTASD